MFSSTLTGVVQGYEEQHTMADQYGENGERRWARREVLSGATALAGLALASAGHAAHHEHSGHHAMAAVDEDLRKSALECVTTGDDCIAHCLSEFQSGDTTLADCAVRVQDLVIACRALAQLAAHRSTHLRAFAKATSEVCRVCEEECRKHAKHHEVCRACASACEHCIEQCERLSA